uniref:DNA helicase n=1 Tax=Adoxophyes orana granulovirus TaxID=170617 RepID=A0A0A7V0Q5_GVAO|nr:DNA helicase [Adoxophyes orana granulovirus]
MSVEDIFKTYESVPEPKKNCNKYWYFVDTSSKKCVRRPLGNTELFTKTLQSADSTLQHSWCMVPNYFLMTKIKPFMLCSDYEQVPDKSIFNFTDIKKRIICFPVKMGDYMVWQNTNVTFLSWALYLYANTKYKIDCLIPVAHNRTIGNFNLINDSTNCLDLACKIYDINNDLIFTNTDKTPKIEMMTVQSKKSIKIYFGSNYVYTTNKVWYNFLKQNENVASVTFLPEYNFVCDKILFQILRYDDEKTPKTIRKEQCVTPSTSLQITDHVSPCSNYEAEFNVYINECLEYINETMISKGSATNNIAKLLEFYLHSSEYSTFYILIIALWQYCERCINMENDYTIEDMLYFVKILCDKVDGGYKLFLENLIYFGNKNCGKAFMKSLCFFVDPCRGKEAFFESICCYFALHFSIYEKTGDWRITASTIKQSEVEDDVKSVGFYKKIKVGKFDYIFTGNIYENYKSKRDHTLAFLMADCPEISVSGLTFNDTINFYHTQDGLFDVCRKTYKEPCPFVVMSTLRKNFIKNNQVFLEKSLFDRIYNIIDTDLDLLKMYHARKFMTEYEQTILCLKECKLANASNSVAILEEKIHEMVVWLLECKGSDILILMMYLKDRLLQYINNIMKTAVDVDLMCMQSAIVAHLLWPNSKIEIFLWSLLYNNFFDYEDSLMDYECDELITKTMFDNKKKIIECVHAYLYQLDYSKCLPFNDDLFEEIKTMVFNIPLADDKKFNKKRILNNVVELYEKYENYPDTYNVWSDYLIVQNKNEDMYTWLTRFYVRIFLNDLDCNDANSRRLHNVVKGLCYFRVFTNFHCNNSKVLINFCASLAIPVDNEKMCIVISSKPNCGKSSLWELLSNIILVHKQDKEVYKHNNNERDEKVKLYESQLYVMNEAQKFTKAYLKSIVDNNRTDSARCNYGVMETFKISFKSLVCNNDDDKIVILDGYDKACSNRIGQIYFDHEFDNDIKEFCGSVYEHHVNKKYSEVRDVVSKLTDSVEAFLANVLKHKCDKVDGKLYYKSILQNDTSYKHNKKCLYIYNVRAEALIYVLNVKECNRSPEFSEEFVIDLIKCAEKYVLQMLHYNKRNTVNADTLLIDFKKRFNTTKFFNSHTKMYRNLQIAKSENYFKHCPPNFLANADIVL